MQRNPKKTQYIERAFPLPSNFGQTGRSFPRPLFSVGRKPLRCRIRGQKGQMCHDQRASWVWEVSPHLPHGKLEHEEGREPWGGCSWLPPPNSCTGIPAQARLLQPIAVFIPAPRHASTLLSYCSDHTRKKAAVFLNVVLWGCIYVVHPIFSTFLPLLSSSTQQARAGEGCR